MYDPESARFMQEDTYRGNANDPLSLNLYTYVNNNPMIYDDQNGHWPSFVDNFVSGVKSVASNVWGAVKETASNAYNTVSSAISSGVSYLANTSVGKAVTSTINKGKKIVNTVTGISKATSIVYNKVVKPQVERDTQQKVEALKKGISVVSSVGSIIKDLVIPKVEFKANNISSSTDSDGEYIMMPSTSGFILGKVKRGIHTCNLCHTPHDGIFIASRNGESLKLGFAEIRVLSEDCKVVFAAPNLIYHYVLDHGYSPPEEFIKAVLNGPKPGTIEYEKFLDSFKEYTLHGKNMKHISITLWGESTSNIEEIKEFHNDIKGGNLERIIELTNSGKEWTNRGIPASKWLYIASSEGQYEIVKYMISCGVEMDVSELTTNPLFAAINGGYINIVKLLIENKIDSSVKYNNEFMKNMDALTFAHKKGKTEIVNLLQSNVLINPINDKKL